MQVSLEIGGRRRMVTVTPESAPLNRRQSTSGKLTPGLYRIVVDDLSRTIDVMPIDPSGWSLLIEGRVYDVAISDNGQGRLALEVDGRSIVASVNQRRATGDEAGHEPGGGRVVSPMPGKVIKVLVNVGDSVEARQPLVVVEAMKMENELRAPIAGRVVEIAASEGMLVDAGMTLVTVQ